jgi:hypothetical protein
LSPSSSIPQITPRAPVARYLDRQEIERLRSVLDDHAAEHPWPVEALQQMVNRVA